MMHAADLIIYSDIPPGVQKYPKVLNRVNMGGGGDRVEVGGGVLKIAGAGRGSMKNF